MHVDFRICDEALEAVPHLSVDGVAPLGPNLSHWPGNRTPRHLFHELSTGICLLYAAERRAGRDPFAEEPHEPIVSNTHYDTDGALSLLAVLRPDVALEHARALLDAAACGDFLCFTTESALALDSLIDGLHDPETSPIAAVRAADGSERDELAYREVLARLPHWLERGLDHPELWRGRVEQVLAEIERLRTDLAAPGRSRATGLCWAETTFHPTRHAWNHVLRADRCLRIGPGGGERRTFLFEYSTRSWFDQPLPPPPRVDLEPVAEELEHLEHGEARWCHDPITFPLPVLYCGVPSPPSFEERVPFLRPSSLPREVVIEVLERHHLRSAHPLGAPS